MIQPPTHTGPVYTAIRPLLERIDAAVPTSRVYGVLPIEKVSDGKEKPVRMPLHLLESGRYDRIVPDEHKDILLFFVQTADAKISDWEPGIGKAYTVTLPLALLVSGQLQQVNDDPEGLRTKLMTVLAGFSPWTTSGFTTQLQDRLFRELDYDFKNHKYLIHPAFGIRIEGILTYMESRC